MKFYQRLAYFLVGLTVGIIFLVYFLGAKAESRGVSFCYFPNCRVLKDLRSKPFYYSEEASKILSESWIDSIDIRNTLLHGDVDFSNSNIKVGNAKRYVVEGKTTQKQPLTLQLLNFESKVLLEKIERNDK
ncbi:MAG: DUF4258 domain-containing protein [Flavobacterium sp.]